MKYLYVYLLLTCIVASCQKETNPNTSSNAYVEYATIQLQFKHTVGTSPLLLNTGTYTNFNGDNFSISTFKYYISNVVLLKSNGNKAIEEESYHLINTATPSSNEFNLKNIPVGEYSSIQFTIGVDSARNVSGAQTGALDPVNGMFWSWSTGYIFTMFEGTSSASPTGNIAFHINGFEAPYNSLRRITLPFPQLLTAKKETASTILFTVDILEMFQTPNTVKFNATYNVTSTSSVSPAIADNYMDMFTVTAIENE